MDNIRNKIWNKAILDSEIIQETVSMKRNDPRFDINFIQDGNDWSLLMCAVYRKRKELIEYLLQTYTNIDVNHRSNQGNTALHFCDKVYILKLLLDRKDLDVNMQNIWGGTGLFDFCIDGRKACVKELLLDARVDTSICDNQGKTALFYSIRNEHPDIAKIINNSRHTTLLRIQNNALIHDIVRMIIEEYL